LLGADRRLDFLILFRNRQQLLQSGSDTTDIDLFLKNFLVGVGDLKNIPSINEFTPVERELILKLRRRESSKF